MYPYGIYAYRGCQPKGRARLSKDFEGGGLGELKSGGFSMAAKLGRSGPTLLRGYDTVCVLPRLRCGCGETPPARGGSRSKGRRHSVWVCLPCRRYTFRKLSPNIKRTSPRPRRRSNPPPPTSTESVPRRVKGIQTTALNTSRKSTKLVWNTRWKTTVPRPKPLWTRVQPTISLGDAMGRC